MDWLKYKKIYFALSGIMIAVSVLAIYSWRLNIGVDFTGGTIIEYRFENEISTEELSKKMEEKEIPTNSIQRIGDNYLLRLSPINESQKNQISEVLDGMNTTYEELRFETVGPSIGPELVKKTIYAILIASVGILLWVAYQFKSFKYGASAILAMFHDSFILVGVFAIFGRYFDAEVDFLFVTALLTTLSFSVHDTIVVFDRIREISKKEGGMLYDVSNKALTETMVRSLNNSFTIIFMLLALVLLGGTTIRWFGVALLVGTVLGTYSSPFVAVPLLNSWDGVVSAIKRIIRKES
ncbi:protein translocase subunit SecF [Patescibacteria group bacterium]